MTYKDTQGHLYTGGAMTRREGNTVFTGIPTKQQLKAWGYTEMAPAEPYTPTEEDIKKEYNELEEELNTVTT